MFQHSNIILVICHMHFRKKSFRSTCMKCMFKSSLNGFSTGQHLSKILEWEILNLAHKKMDNNVENNRNANSPIYTVTAACRNIPYTDEAVKEARTELFSIWYTFGPPAVFFTISQGDEYSFRIKLFVKQIVELLSQPDMDKNECISDILYHSKLCIDNPGACAREDNSIMQIILECLIGWDFKLGKQGSLRIFAEVLGWCGTTKEQARYSLHSHVLLFIANFEKFISLLWSSSDIIRKKHKMNLVNI